jgi:ABC-type branched-subunit amino acid transport system ATPase component
VRASYGALRVLDGVCLTLRGGQVHALVGPNGSGKSTLLKVLAGELEPDAGSVEIGGRVQPARSSPERRVRAGVARTPQGTVVPPLSPARQVAVAARGGNPAPLAVARDLLATPTSRAAALTRTRVADTALRLTALTDVAECDPAALTVGEQRLLQVARAVATGAGVLLLDEPAAGMTAGERERLRGVLRALAGNGLAVLLVEHDMALVGAVADRVTVLAAGRVLATGRPDAVRADPAVRAAYLGSAGVAAAHGGGGAA